MSDASPMLLDLENCYVVTEEGSIDSNFATGKLQVESEGNGPSSACDLCGIARQQSACGFAL